MKKFKIGPSFLLLIVLCLTLKNFLLLINYFSALFLHELAHLFVAKSRGYNLKQMRLDIFGLSLNLKEEVDGKDAFAINISGPICNLLICLICFAFYYFVPSSVVVLNTFCLSNFALAIFNLLPIYPLDGGKIFRGLIQSDKVYKLLDKFIRYSFVVVFLILFICSCFNKVNILFAVMVVFFLTSKAKQEHTLSIFKFSKKSQQKVRILKVDENIDIFTLVKQLKKSTYTIFYCKNLNKKYLDEDELINLSLIYQLNTKLKDVKNLT